MGGDKNGAGKPGEPGVTPTGEASSKEGASSEGSASVSGAGVAKDAPPASSEGGAKEPAPASEGGAKDPPKSEEKALADERRQPSSPWPSARKNETPPSAPPKAPPKPVRDPDKAAWGAPLEKLDQAWTRLEAKICAGVLVAEILTLVFWIAIRSLSSTGRGGGGLLFRCLVTAVVVTYGVHRATKKHPRHALITTGAFFGGLGLGFAWGDAGTAYFANLFAWLQNSSILVFFGGVNEIAKRLTLWLALLGASLATAQGKHINVDVAMRFLAPRARVPVAVLGWLTAAVVSIAASWGFFDYVAVEEMRAPTTVQCENPRGCPAPAGSKVSKVLASSGRNLFLAGRQITLDVRSLPKVVSGTPYNKWLTPHDWNEWVRGGGWEGRFEAEDVKALELPEDGSIDFRNPSVTAIPGGTEAIPKILVPMLNLVFAFGLLVIGVRFLLRSALAIAGWVKVDPNAAHGDEGLAHAHDHSPQADAVEKAIADAEHPSPYRDPAKSETIDDAPTPKGVRVAFGSIGGVVALLGAIGGALVAMVGALALLGTPLFAIMGGAAELAWLTHPNPDQQVLRRLASDVFGPYFAGSPILATIPLFTFVGYTMAEAKTAERLVRSASAWLGWLPGGLAIVCVIASAIFTLFTGGSGVTIIAVGGLLLPALRKSGYSEKFSLGLVTTGGSLGLLLPMALPLLVYAMISGLPLQLVNKAVILPGLFVLAVFCVYAVRIGIKEKIPSRPFQPMEALRSTWEFKWEIGIFVLLILGVATQMTSIDEAAGFVALYTLAIEVFIYKDLTIKKDLVRIAKSSMSLAGAVILILAMANALINYVEYEHLPNRVLDAMLKSGFDKTWQFLIVLNVFLLVLGMIMDGFSAILVAVPLVLPFASYFGLGPFHVAIMFVLNLELAFSCPPLGLNLFIASFRFNRPVVSLYRIVPPFVGLLAFALLVVTYVPRMSSLLVESDIDKWRQQAKAENRIPSEAWFLECVQLDRNNPQPCSDADKKAFPNGKLPEAAVATPEVPVDAGAAPGAGNEEDDDILAAIRGKEAGAPKAPEGDSEDDLLAAIRGGAKDGGADSGDGDASAKPAPKPGQETDDDLMNMIKGKP